MMLSHERIPELVMKTKGQLSDNYSSYHNLPCKDTKRNYLFFMITNYLLIDGH